MSLTFDSATHTYRLNGARLPSVTQILSPYSSLEFVDRDLLERAAAFGTHVHEACHLFSQDALDRESLDSELAPYVDAWAAFLEDTGAVVLLSEQRVVSEQYGYAGTLDAIVWWGKSKRLIDIKSSTGVPKTVGPQTAGYAQAYREQTGEPIRDRYCVQLKPDGTYRSHKLSDPADWSIFLSALNLNRWFYGAKQ